MGWCEVAGGGLFPELAAQPVKQAPLIVHAGDTHSPQKPRPAWRLLYQILGTLIACRAQGAKIGEFVTAAERTVDDVADVEANLPSGVDRVGLPGTRTTHLAGIAVTFENQCALCRRNTPGKPILSGLWRIAYEPILPRPQTAVVVMTVDWPSLFVSEFAQPSGPLGRGCRRLAELLLRDDLSDSAPEKLSEPVFGAAQTRMLSRIGVPATAIMA